MVFDGRPPGSPGGIRELAAIWRGAATGATEAADTLDSAKGDVAGGALKLQGDFAPRVVDAIQEVPGELRRLSTGYRLCAAALEKYAATLEEKQRTWDLASEEYHRADRSRQLAELDLDRLAPHWTPDREPGLDLERFQDAALNGQPDLGPQIAEAWRRRKEASSLAEMKRTVAADAAAMRRNAEDVCASEINAALDTADIRNEGGLKGFVQELSGWAPSWSDFVKICETLSTVLGVVAMFAGPLAPVIGALAAAAAAVVVLDKLFKLASGELTWKSMAGELAMVAFSRVGGKAVGSGWKAYRKSDLSKRVSGHAHRAADRVVSKRVGDQTRNRVHREVCRFTGHPVDIATGKVYTSFTDLELPGPLPLTLDRVWFSTSTYVGPLGHGWHHAYDAAVLVTTDEIVYRSPDGRYVDLLYLLAGESTYERQERITIARDVTGFRITGADGLTRRFEASSTPIVHADDPITFTLREVVSRGGHRITCTRDDHDRLFGIVGSSGRDIGFTYDDRGRSLELTAPHPDRPGERFTVATYSYDDADNLVSMTDARGHEFRYSYDGHLLVEEVDRTGLTFHFRYDGTDETARCTSTWGDNDLYRRTLVYEPGSTVVVNSLGHATRHDHEGGLVVRTVDALGGETRTTYDYAQPVEEVDALGRATTYVYDWRGNERQVTTPDGAMVTVDYNESNQPVRAVDQAGGEWGWEYDATGLLSSRRDPLDRTTRIDHARGLPERVIDPAGGATLLRYDVQASLVELTTPDGAVTSWGRNALGWPVATTDPLGNITRRVFDLGGNVTRVEEPDGNVRELNYDGEANLTSAVDVLYDVRLAYQGMGRLASRTQAGTTVRFEYDTEEQLTALVNEHGHVYRFTYNPTGLVQTERTFGEVLRIYERDVAGRVVTVRRASGLTTRHEYDDVDRVVRVTHSDGSSQRFTYRADGALLMAGNDTVDVVFVRDVLGRLLRETQGEHWVASEYDDLDRRIRMTSSMGADQRYTRNAMGDVVSVEGNGYTAQFTRDALGQELVRSLPGGAEARWHRDQFGRPIRQEIATGGGNVHRVRDYEWSAGGRLRGILDNIAGPVRYAHDGLGQLVSATYGDGNVELRMPDAVGNLFRTEDRSDREYGPAGQVLRALDDGGRWFTYDYDAEGNLIGKTADDGERWEYRWYADGNMAAVLRPDGTEVTSTYDALSRRVTKSHGGQTTHGVWDGDNPVHEEVYGKGAIVSGNTQRLASAFSDEYHSLELATARMFSDSGDLLLERTSEGAAWTINDQVGSLLDVVRSDNATRGDPESDQTSYGLWPGAAIGRRNGAIWNIGRYRDSDTGLEYNRHRYFDAHVGTYISQDPIRLLAGTRLYAHVRDPITQVDPLGLASCRANARKLRDNLFSHKNAFRPGSNKKLKGWVAAHLVPSGGSLGHWESGRRMRELLHSYDIDVNDAANGALLPRYTDGFTHSRAFLDSLEARLTSTVLGRLDAYSPEVIREALLFELDEVGFHVGHTGMAKWGFRW